MFDMFRSLFKLGFNVMKLPLTPFLFLNKCLAKGIILFFKVDDSNEKDKYGIARTLLHGTILIGSPHWIANHYGYLLTPFDIPFLVLGVYGSVSAWKNQYMDFEKKTENFGSAKFAETKDLRKSKMFGETGVVFGKTNNLIGKSLVVKSEKTEGHVAVLGGSGLGKTATVVTPSMMRWKGSALVLDPKGGELANKTALIRSRFQKCYIFNPMSQSTSKYNPIDFCDTPDKSISISQILIPLEDPKYSFFTESARAIVAAATHEGYLKEKSLVEVCEYICTSTVEDMANHFLTHDNKTVRILAAPLLHLKENTLANVMSDLIRNLNTIATSDHIRRATSHSDFSVKALEEHSTIYLSIPEEKLKLPQYRKLLSIILNQGIDHLTERKEKKDPPVLLLIDELYTLGNLPSLIQGLATLRSRNVHILLSFQSLAQLDELYGVNGRKMILDNCRYKLVLGIEDPETQEYFTKLAGQQTIETMSRDRERNKESERYNQTGVPLIRSEEWSDLEKPILFSFKTPPCKVDPIYYWKDNLLHRLMRKDLRILNRKELKKERILDEIEEKLNSDIDNVIELPEKKEGVK
ncbi:type IV secretory system conjugative DNA transfer family protein [Hazenella coriacea]|uniref:Type IV secretory pathway TraG/TraD family ATPase VirD4 n=1 Tax=Hazenella coriacea TaxID=1179467 RepID=A0A4R3L0V5_9BACL|nr:type IV secretory system conjugative DNA transfer family protein [Hazenella coriacea]TCS92221.1 type IV secretory pathway TraG/TraD family ATPase VirD4 [Hazenella coriacea]